MKRIIKFIVLIFIAIFISCIFTCKPVKSAEPNEGLDKTIYNYKKFVGLEPAAQGFNLYFNHLVETPAYLCAWHGGHFFYRQPVIIEYRASFYNGHWEGEYKAKETWEHFVDGRWERDRANKGADTFIITKDITEWENVKLSIDSNDIKSTFNIELEATAYSGKAYYPSVNKIWGPNEAEGSSKNPSVSVTSTGWTRFWVTERHKEKNNAMAYLLADCDENVVAPRASYVNVAFWAHLGDTSTETNTFSKPGDDISVWESMGSIPQRKGTPSTPSSDVTPGTLNSVGSSINKDSLMGISASNISEATTSTKAILKEVEWYLQALEEGKKLTNDQCDILYNTALEEQEDQIAYQLFVIKEQYKNGDKNDAELISQLKQVIEKLITDMKYNAEKNNKKEEEQQNSQDFNGMWQEIGDDYEKKIADKTKQDEVIVEYNATTQKYLIGPFQIEYVEKYTSDWTLASMAGDPVLTVRKDDSTITIPRSSGKWNFYYLNGLRVEGVPGTENGQDRFGYNQYPHSNEPFYIQLNYEDGINAILGLEVHFRYMQAEAEWSKSEGEIENVKWSGGLGFSRCSYESGFENSWTKALCDGGGYEELEECHDEVEITSTSGVVHYHPNKDNRSTPCTGCTTVKRCDGHGHSSSCSEDCSSDHKCSGCIIDHYVCNGHECRLKRACTHGFGGDHYAAFYLWIEGSCDGTAEPIQFIGTCHWAWRLYFDVSKKIEWNIDITTGLAGDVWLDIDAQKDEAHANVKDGDKETVEHGVQDVLVTIKLYQDGSEVGEAIAHDENGTRIQWPQRTNENGHYEVNRIEAPGRDGGKDCYYVAEFAYDGQVYESTVFLQNGDGDDTAKQYMDAKGAGYSNKSMAVERYPERRQFDESFTQIYGDSEMQGDYSTIGISSSNTSNNPIQYKGESETNGSASMIKSEFISAATEDHENMKDNWEKSYDRYRIKAYTHYSAGTEITDGSTVGDYQIYYPFDDEGKAYGSGEIRYIMNNNRDGASGGKRYIDKYMLHINLGLKKRKETDISLLKDLYKMTIVVNEQEIVQNFNCLVDSTGGGSTVTLKYNASFEALKEKLEERRANGETSVNNLGLFSTDVAYNATSRYGSAIDKVQEIKSGTELRVFATYAIRIYNNSDTNDVTINELTDYYDKAYTVIDSEDMIGMEEDGIHAKVVNDDMERTYKLVADKPYYRILNTQEDYDNISWKPTKEENLKDMKKQGDLTWTTSGTAGDMKKSTTESFKDIKLKVNEYIEIFTTYEIDYEGYRTITNENNSSDDIAQRSVLYANDEKNNIAEISNYSTFYSERDVQTEDGAPVNFYKAYKEKDNSGKIDKDSAPNNIKTSDITNVANYEDDTCRALPLKISLEANERDMYGYVFEDERSEKNSNGVTVNTGNGIYGGSDKLIKNVKVSMFEVISLADTDEPNIKYNDLEYYYEVPLKYYNIGESSTTGIATGDNAIVTSDTAISGKEGNYCIYGYLPGDYVLRFDYGTQADSTENVAIVDKDGNVVSNPTDVIKYNGQDYENTSFLSASGYKALNDKYLNLRTEDMKTANGGEGGIKAIIQQDDSPAYSVARDNESRRMVVDAYSRTIENGRGEILRDRKDDTSEDNGRYVEATAMFAETPIMQIEINEPKKLNEDDTDLEGSTQLEPVKTIDNGVTGGENNKKLNVTNQEYHIKNINFGLEERARTDIRIEQYIESIFLMKNEEVIFSATLNEDGTVITDHEDSMHLDKLTYLTHVEADRSNQQGFYAISVEDDYLNGLSMAIDYRIKIVNNSEIDFTGTLAKYYVAKDIVKAASFSPTTEGYTVDIAKLLEEENETGLATNTTLAEILRLHDGDVTLSGLLSQQDKTRVGAGNISENDTLRPDMIVYGKYVGRYYYENEVDEGRKKYTIKQYKWAGRPDVEITYQSDKVVKTTVDQLIGYIDTNASYDLSTQNYENCAWDLSGNIENTGTRRTIPTLDELVSESSYRTIVDSEGVEKSNIYDRKGNALVTDVSSNIVIAKNNKLTKFDTLSGENPTGSGTYLVDRLNDNWVEYRDDYTQVKSKDNRALTVELTPKKYKEKDSKVEMWLMTTKTTASDTDANNMKFDNLVEVLVYSNPTGRRDYYSVPGNAMALATNEDIGLWKAGYNSKLYWQQNGAPADDKVFDEIAAKEWYKYPEDDAYAPEFVTIIAPTGITLREYVKNVIIPITILVVIIITMFGIFSIKQIKIYKERKEDK